MRLSICALGALAGLALAVPATSSYANVNLLLSKKGAAGTTSFSVPAGGSFDISVTLVTTSAEQATGVDYFLKSTLGGSSANGIFTLASQDLSTSVFTSFNGGSFSSAVLNPISQDEGSGLNDPFNQPPVSGGPFEVADFHVLLAASVAVGSTYTLAIADNGNSVLSYAGPASSSFASAPFTNTGSLAITVTAAVPEPVSALLACGAAFLFVRRRRSC